MKHTFLLFATLLMIASCSRGRLKGEGATISETRISEPFTIVNCNGSNNVRFFKDSSYRVVVTGYENLVGAYSTRVSGGKLKLEYKDRYIVRNDNISVDIYAPDFNEVSLNGSGNIQISDGFQGVFTGEINGSGNIVLQGGDFVEARYRVNGSGNIRARNATAQKAYAKISGSGNIELTVEEYLEARISGSGDIHYWGNPAIDIHVSGSGNVKKW